MFATVIGKRQGTASRCSFAYSASACFRYQVLQKAGYEVLTARSGKEALQLTASHKVDLILSGYLMPNMSGTELAAQVKSQNPTLPVLLLSGLNELPLDSQLPDGFLSKIEGDALCQHVVSYMHSRRAQS